jgi:hypothetical protein
MPVHEFANYTPEEKEEFLRLAATLEHEWEVGDRVTFAIDTVEVYVDQIVLIAPDGRPYVRNEVIPDDESRIQLMPLDGLDAQWLPTADQLLDMLPRFHYLNKGEMDGMDFYSVQCSQVCEEHYDSVRGHSPRKCLALLRAICGEIK